MKFFLWEVIMGFCLSPADTEGIGGQINWLVRQLYIWGGELKKASYPG